MADSDSTYIGCPNCGVRYRWRNELASKKILCPCGCKFRMPNIAAGPPTTITLPPKGNAVTANPAYRSGSGLDSADPQPIATSDAVGELARLHLLDDLKQKIDNDGTLSSGRFVIPSANSDSQSQQYHSRREHRHSSPTVGEDGRLQLDLDDPLLPSQTDESPPSSGITGISATTPPSGYQDPGATGNYDLNLDAFTPASSVINPNDSTSSDTQQPKPNNSGAMAVGEAISRADMKKRRRDEEEHEVLQDHLRRAYVYPLGCIIFGLCLIVLNILVLGPKIDAMSASQSAIEQAKNARTGNSSHFSFFGTSFDDTPARDEPDKRVQLDNSKPNTSPDTQALVKAPVGKDGAPVLAKAHAMPGNLMARESNAEYARLEAAYVSDVRAPAWMIGRSLKSIIFMFLSTIFGFIGLLLCVKLMGSAFDGIISTMLKLIAIAFVLEGSLTCVDACLDLITDGFGSSHSWVMTGALGYGLFWAMCAWLLEMNPIEITIMYASVYILSKVVLVALFIYVVMGIV
jgi:hypothetical protein